MKSTLVVTVEADEKSDMDSYLNLVELAVDNCLCNRKWLRSYKVERIVD